MILDIFVPFQQEAPMQQGCRGVALELYGPQHLTANTLKQTGKAVLRQSLIQVSLFLFRIHKPHVLYSSQQEGYKHCVGHSFTTEE